ncbi:MAG: NRDE family protein [bacterium]|nr:NRDE family protein [bacterium]
MVIYHRVSSTYPLIVASNRDERSGRPSSPPSVLVERPRVIGGRDLKAGGTWMGVNAFGLWIGVANRSTAALPEVTRRSRGLLCLDLLREETSHDVWGKLGGLGLDDYNPLLLAVADREAGFVLGNGPDPGPWVMEPGMHVLTNGGFDQDGDPRSDRLREELLIGMETDGTPTAQILARSLKDHGKDVTDALCIHGPAGGTQSSTILALHQDLRCSSYYYAGGPPCRTGYTDYSFLFPGAAPEGPGVTNRWGTDILGAHD